MNETTEAMEPQLLGPQITRFSFFNLQVCVPGDYTDEQAEAFANRVNPAGTICGWHIRREGDPGLNGDPERVPCDTRQGCVHIVMDC